MKIVVLDFSNGETDIIDNAPHLHTTEEVENYLSEALGYNPDEINFMFAPEIKVNELEPEDYNVEEEVADRYRLIAQIHSQHKGYVDEHKAEPKFARCRIKYHDDGTEMDVTIKLTDEEVGFDEDIFFSCNGVNELIDLCYEETEDFDLWEVYELMGSL